MGTATPDILRAFQAALRSHREAAGLSTPRMAAELGMTRQNYAELENSGRAPSIVTGERIARHFGCDLAAFLIAGKESLDRKEDGR